MRRPLAVPLIFWVRHATGAKFSCDDDVDNWHTWDNDKKTWCCEQEDVACEPRHYEESPDCQGYSEEFGECANNPPCRECDPVNCEFGSWGEWYGGGACSGVHFRHRSVRRENNECGKPCTGAKVESVSTKLEPGCLLDVTDCGLAKWSEWSVCEDLAGQSVRKREVSRVPTHGGLACNASLEETRPCPNSHTDCVMGDWHDWTHCSVTCGNGRKTRTRSIAVRAKYGGRACTDVKLMTAPCSITDCEKKDCEVTDWSEWSKCHGEHLQRYRHRTMKAGSGAGKPCHDGLVETKGCPEGPTPEGFSTWEEWTDCSEKCGGGVRYRSRRLLSIQAKRFDDGEGHVMRTVEPCNTQSCSRNDAMCEATEWTDWSECDAECGAGSRARHRKIKKVAASTDPKDGCNMTLKELTSCDAGKCKVSDCKWSDWESWSDCSLKCGGGMRTRNRQVLAGPRNGGKLCEPQLKAEVRPCHTQECEEHCVNGTWAEWEDWSACSTSCATGYRSRRRSVDTPPRNCGQPPSGVQEEFQECPDNPPCIGDVDCELNKWSPWSSCSCSCFGVMERTRTIKTHALGNGKRCDDDALKELSPCNPASAEDLPPGCAERPDKACILSSWTDWSHCSQDCGGGQMTRARSIIQKPFRGEACMDSLSAVAPCNTQPCHQEDQCLPCLWADWSEWGDCSACNGERWRHRGIAQMPNQCGVSQFGICDMKDAKQVEACTGECERTVCAWSEWSEPLCSATCGNSATVRSRELKSVEVMPDGCRAFCEKRIVEVPRPTPPTTPKLTPPLLTTSTYAPGQEPFDCNSDYGDWQNSWSTQKKQFCCQHHSKGCEAPTPMPPPPEPFDCEAGLGQWKDGWSDGKKKWCCKNHQLGCPESQDDYDETGDSPFAKCNSRSCPDGLVWKSNPASTSCCHDKGCKCTDDDMRKHCCQEEDAFDCFEDAKHPEDWAADKKQYCCEQHQVNCPEEKLHFDCDAGLGNFLLGWSDKKKKWCCEQEDKGCEDRRLKEYNCDADYGEWKSAWSDDKKAYCCDTKLRGCPEDDDAPEDFDCKHGYGNWQQDWSPEKKAYCCAHHDMGCSEIDDADAHCSHQHDKDECEKIVLYRPWLSPASYTPCTWDGKRCKGDIKSTEEGCPEPGHLQDKACHEKAPPGFLFDRMGDIEICAGTQANVSMCPAEKACTSCVPRDCIFSDWTDWVTLDCMGLKQRQRSIAIMNNQCGRVCDGPLAETEKSEELCLAQEEDPCQLSAWSDWSVCEKPWSQKYRTRKILVKPLRTTKTCDANLQETTRCCEKPGLGPCEFSEWSAWGPCTVECGDGVRTRSREIARMASPGMDPCNGDLHMVEACNMGPCEKRKSAPCLFSTWSDWSSCAGGKTERVRTRKIESAAIGDGKQCEGTLQTVKGCDNEKVDCEMSAWTRWSDCDRTCGGGQHFRTRQIDVFPENGGQSCPSNLVETDGCSETPCSGDEDCEVGRWSPWGECSVSCGQGYQQRDRVVTSKRKPTGVGCLAPLSEVKVCHAKPCERTDCRWRDWEEWSACSCKCDGGMRTRTRNIGTMPSSDGKACDPVDKEQVEACNTEPCEKGNHIVDGAWSEWGDWSQCSATCLGGERYRTRFVAREANKHGVPAHGPLRQTEFCNDFPCVQDQDCNFEDWAEWSVCTTTCDGVKKRERRIKEYGKGQGQSCEGHLKETEACEIGCGHHVEPAVDCDFEEWSDWTSCTAACGTGQHSRGRRIKSHAANGGTQCTGPESEVRQCEANPCPKKAAVNCELGEWEEWGACTKCDGQRMRSRQIKRYPLHGGKPCNALMMEDTEPCPGSCGDEGNRFCTWNAWTQWTTCSTSCGAGP
eukprot:TRINITY_DN21711_c0_g1_i1.p1 TRINITY_DN21711_c0_g1~~TRINITY_DN21711_c0_g1_i1.p1  ORF type:complete len:1837 (-),score=319.72 TRINITY_DN21711_c0_g1_i1:105-5615(-)